MNIHEEITKIQTATKRGEMPREVRMVKIDALTEDYYAKTGAMPDAVALERLSDLCLYEELTDDDRMKVRNNEYPFLSETQIARRQEGKHARKDNVSGEVPLMAATSRGVDGRDYGMPTRRDRNKRENGSVDNLAKSRNSVIKQKYMEFTKVQPVVSYKI